MIDLKELIHAAQSGNGVVRIPAGTHVIHEGPICHLRASLAIIGEGEGVTRLVFDSCSGPMFFFEQEGAQQPHGLTIEGVSFVARGQCGTGIVVSYASPEATSDHYRQSVRLRDVSVSSGSDGSWRNGISIHDAWNITMDNVYVSGSSAGGVWDNLEGAGISLHRMCVNAHFTNVRTNFWAVGIEVHADRHNTEGIFCSNCSMVGVKRGVWIRGNPSLTTGRISTFNWTGGMIEGRTGGVKGGSAGIHLQNVWTALITGCQMITETITLNVENTYGVIAQDCHGIVVSACDINAWTHGVFTTGDCRGILVANNTFTNTATQVVLNPGTVDSRSGPNVRVNDQLNEQDWGERNVFVA
jgi:hypothetical protein